MLTVWVVAAACAAAPDFQVPVLDPLNGSVVTAGDRALLPSGRSVSSVADLWLVQWVNGQPGAGGGIARFDPVALSADGRSATQIRFFVNTLDVTDPARPGQPLLSLPFDAWDQLRVRSMWTWQPGLTWWIEPATRPRALARLSWGGAVGGGTWIPSHLMDREPALRFGADPYRRRLQRASDLELATARGKPGSGVRLLAEVVDDSHRYPTLVDPSRGTYLDDAAQRATVLATGAAHWGALPVHGLVAWQADYRAYAGAEDRLPVNLTHSDRSTAALAQVGTYVDLGKQARLQLDVGAGWRDDNEHPNSQQAAVWDLQAPLLWRGQPRFAERLRRSRIDVAAATEIGPRPAPIRLTFTGAFASLISRAHIPDGRTGISDAYVTLYDPAQRAEEWLRQMHLGLDWRAHRGAFSWRLAVGLDDGAVGIPSRQTLGDLSPAAGLALVWHHGGSQLFALARREPLLLTAEVSAFLDPARPSGRIYRWNDNGDGTIQADELGPLVARTGGLYHRAGAHLQRPCGNRFAIGWRTPRFGAFRAVLTAVGRVLTNRYTVRLAGKTASSYTPVTVSNGAGGTLTAYARTPGTAGQEIYELTNDPRNNFYTGAEFQLFTDGPRWWFVSLAAAGYWNVGAAPFGFTADTNDAGIISESSADPNARVNSYGRVDADRSFAINLIAGLRPLPGLSAAAVLRYRDGEPFAHTVVANLPQGPTVLMTQPRGAPVPRFTFAMTLDVRLRYDLALGPWDTAVMLDAFNLLGSGTELSEDIRSGPDYRRSLEMVPGRTLMASVELHWN